MYPKDVSDNTALSSNNRSTHSPEPKKKPTLGSLFTTKDQENPNSPEKSPV